MNSLTRLRKGGSLLRRAALGPLGGLGALALAACSQAGASNAEVYTPPAPLALVALVDPTSGRMAEELHQLQDVIRTTATPGEALVVMILQPSYGQAYEVKRGDSLSSIAAAHGISLAALEAANPQLGPLSGRNWKLIHPTERVIIPDGSAQEALLLVSRAPSGPPPPNLVRLPRPPSNPTDFQRAQYNRTVAAGNATNSARIAAWRADADKSLQPWQQQVVDELGKKAATSIPGARAPDGRILASSLTAGVTTLKGLPGRRLLLLLGGGESGPGALAPRSFADINVVIANLEDSSAAAAWTAAGSVAGAASVNALDPALTRLQLAQVVNQQ
jgi:LysM repeat protein